MIIMIFFTIFSTVFSILGGLVLGRLVGSLLIALVDGNLNYFKWVSNNIYKALWKDTYNVFAEENKNGKQST